VVIVTVASVIETVDTGAGGFDSAALARIDDWLREKVAAGIMPGYQLVISRRGEIAHASVHGLRDVEAGLPVVEDTLWRIYSMTKPVVAVAAMMLWEQGRFQLTDEISRWLPEFASMRVYDSEWREHPATEPIRVWHLLTHTSGLTYHFMLPPDVGLTYPTWGPDTDSAEMVRQWAARPLMFEPGTHWDYSVATDVLGHLIEVISGQTLAEFIADRIAAPLGMTDLRWWDETPGRLAAAYATGLHRSPETDAFGRTKPPAYSGGGGLLSTAADYQRFTASLLGHGPRLLGPRTIAFMARNHLPGGLDIPTLSLPYNRNPHMAGIGHGLGVGVWVDPIPGRVPMSPGSYYWGGAASTVFWIDPVEDLSVEFYTQVVPSIEQDIRPTLASLAYAALADRCGPER